MLKIDWAQIEILDMPGEHRPKVSEVDIRRVNPFQNHVIKPVVQTRIQFLQIPLRAEVIFEKRALDVTSVQRGL